jgi:hypothetical protein
VGGHSIAQNKILPDTNPAYPESKSRRLTDGGNTGYHGGVKYIFYNTIYYEMLAMPYDI